jgi:hypothetical protein
MRLLTLRCLLLVALGAFLPGCSGEPAPQEEVPINISVWYGDDQVLGQLGRPQPWINVLGQIEGAALVDSVTYQLNGGPEKTLSLGPDRHRLAEAGDFNVNLPADAIRDGKNDLDIVVYPKAGAPVSKRITLQQESPSTWPFPYAIDFREVKRLAEVVQVVDGLWSLEKDGVRTVTPYYDRVLAMGDTTWRDYEATIKLTVHGFTPSADGPPTYGVTHFGVALRWRGHHPDGLQPHRKWFPLGSQGEFLLKENPDSNTWRILFDGIQEKPPTWGVKRNRLVIGNPMFVKAQVATLSDGRSRYRFKQWMADVSEPAEWDIEGFEKGDYPSGALCLVPHNSDVTIHSVAVDSIAAD